MIKLLLPSIQRHSDRISSTQFQNEARINRLSGKRFKSLTSSQFIDIFSGCARNEEEQDVVGNILKEIYIQQMMEWRLAPLLTPKLTDKDSSTSAAPTVSILLCGDAGMKPAMSRGDTAFTASQSREERSVRFAFSVSMDPTPVPNEVDDEDSKMMQDREDTFKMSSSESGYLRASTVREALLIPLKSSEDYSKEVTEPLPEYIYQSVK